MPTYTAAAAQQRLPAGGTRLHRAILKNDLSAVHAWLQAGADVWAESASLPRTWTEVMARRKNHELFLSHHQTLPAIGLALLLYLHAPDGPAHRAVFEAVLDGTDLTQDSRAMVIRVALSKYTRPADLMGELARRRVPLVSQHQPPSDEAARHLTRMTISELDQWVAVKGQAAFYAQFAPGQSMLDLAFRYRQRAIGAQVDLLTWLDRGMPLADPQQALVHWATMADTRHDPAHWEAVAQALLDRGATPEGTIGMPGYTWTAASAALSVGAVSLQARQERTAQDEAAEVGSPTLLASLLLQHVNDSYYGYTTALTRAMAQGIHPDRTGPTATGVRQLLTQLPVFDNGSGPRWDAFHQQTQRWLTWAQAAGVPDAGVEANQACSAFDLWWTRACDLVSRQTSNSDQINVHKLNAELDAWAAYAHRDIHHHMQGWLSDLFARPITSDTVTMAGLLLERGATPFIPDTPGQTPWSRVPTRVAHQWLALRWRQGASPFVGVPCPPELTVRTQDDRLIWETLAAHAASPEGRTAKPLSATTAMSVEQLLLATPNDPAFILTVMKSYAAPGVTLPPWLIPTLDRLTQAGHAMPQDASGGSVFSQLRGKHLAQVVPDQGPSRRRHRP